MASVNWGSSGGAGASVSNNAGAPVQQGVSADDVSQKRVWRSIFINYNLNNLFEDTGYIARVHKLEDGDYREIAALFSKAKQYEPSVKLIQTLNAKLRRAHLSHRAANYCMDVVTKKFHNLKEYELFQAHRIEKDAEAKKITTPVYGDMADIKLGATNEELNVSDNVRRAVVTISMYYSDASQIAMREFLEKNPNFGVYTKPVSAFVGAATARPMQVTTHYSGILDDFTVKEPVTNSQAPQASIFNLGNLDGIPLNNSQQASSFVPITNTVGDDDFEVIPEENIAEIINTQPAPVVSALASATSEEYYQEIKALKLPADIVGTVIDINGGYTLAYVAAIDAAKAAYFQYKGMLVEGEDNKEVAIKYSIKSIVDKTGTSMQTPLSFRAANVAIYLLLLGACGITQKEEFLASYATFRTFNMYGDKEKYINKTEKEFGKPSAEFARFLISTLNTPAPAATNTYEGISSVNVKDTCADLGSRNENKKFMNNFIESLSS